MTALRIPIEGSDQREQLLSPGAVHRRQEPARDNGAEAREIGIETHDVDQFIYVVAGEGRAMINGSDAELEKGDAVCVPAGERHNVVNTSDEPMKLVTVYSPPEHLAGLVQESKPIATPA